MYPNVFEASPSKRIYAPYAPSAPPALSAPSAHYACLLVFQPCKAYIYHMCMYPTVFVNHHHSNAFV